MRFVEQQKNIWRALRGKPKMSIGDRKRAYFLLFAYCLGIGAMTAGWMNFIAGWVSSGLLQLIMLIFAMIYALNIADCRDKCLNVLECERTVNPLMEVYVGLRALQVVHAIVFLHSTVLAASFAVSLLILALHISRGMFFVDATSLWREIGSLERQSYLHMFIDVVLFVVYLVTMILSIIKRYSE